MKTRFSKYIGFLIVFLLLPLTVSGCSYQTTPEAPDVSDAAGDRFEKISDLKPALYPR